MASRSILAILEENSRIKIPNHWETEILSGSGRVVIEKLVWEQLDYLIEILKKASRGSGFRLALQSNTISARCPCDRFKRREILMIAQIWENHFHATLQLIE